MAKRWYTVTVVEHAVHPDRRTEDSPPPVVSVACTVPPKEAVWVLRAAADELAEQRDPTPVNGGGPAGSPLRLAHPSHRPVKSA